jgi:hypothetical protein
MLPFPSWVFAGETSQSSTFTMSLIHIVTTTEPPFPKTGLALQILL